MHRQRAEEAVGPMRFGISRNGGQPALSFLSAHASTRCLAQQFRCELLRRTVGNAQTFHFTRFHQRMIAGASNGRRPYTVIMDINPAELSVRDRYKLMIGSIVPRPIAFVSTLSPDGRANLAPFSFFNGIGSDPMTLLFCPADNADGSEKDTLRNCKPTEEGGTGEFVVNVATERYMREVSAAGEGLPYGESEFELTGLEPAPSVVVAPPRVAISPVAFECRTVQIVRMNPDKPASGNIVIGEIVHVIIHDEIIDERYRIDPDRLAAIGRMGGASYCRTRDRFDLPRGRDALAQAHTRE